MSDRKSIIIHSHTGMRGVAALCVFITHLGCEQAITLGFNQQFLLPFYWSDMAVDLFFILSGFILNWVYFRDGALKIEWRSYLRARCARILPLYYLTLAPFLPPTVRTLHFYGASHEHWKHFSLLMGNLLLLAGFAGESHWEWMFNGPAWSISVEFFAYLFLMPLMVFLFRRWSQNALAAVFAVSLIGLLLCYGTINHDLWGWNWCRLGRGFFGFPLGFALCSLLMRRGGKDDDAGPVVALTSVVVMLLSLYYILPRILILCILPFLVYFTVVGKGIICRFLDRACPQWLGERSYSIYLWHTPIMYVFFIPNLKMIDAWMPFSKGGTGIANMLLVIASVFLVSELSYRFFETPMRTFLRTPLRDRISGLRWRESLPVVKR
jgi:peptidoglycan/LPS O-acetylase OafA/YrhL